MSKITVVFDLQKALSTLKSEVYFIMQGSFPRITFGK